MAVPLTAALTGAELVRDGNSGFIRPQSLGELQANLQSQVWQRSDLFTMAPTATATSASESFAFSTASLTGAVTTTGTATTLRVQYQPSASPTLPLTDSSLVLLAELASTGRAVTTPLTVQYLDACGVNTAGQQVDQNPCNPGDACVSIFQNSAWDFQCTPPIIVTLPPDTEAATASAGSGGDNLALWIAIILVILIAILIAAVLYFRRQKNAHEEWDGRDDNRSRLPTYHNPTYVFVLSIVLCFVEPLELMNSLFHPQVRVGGRRSPDSPRHHIPHWRGERGVRVVPTEHEPEGVHRALDGPRRRFLRGP